MASAYPSVNPQECDKCSQSSTTLRQLTCVHIICLRCATHAFNEYKLKTDKSDQLECPVCGKGSTVPGGKPVNLPQEPQPGSTVEALAKLNLDPKAKQSSATNECTVKSNKLLWTNKKYKEIVGCIEFFSDGSIIFIGYIRNQSKELTGSVLARVGIDGKHLELPFPNHFNTPFELSLNRSTETLLVKDFTEDGEQVLFALRKTKGTWACKSFCPFDGFANLAGTDNIVCHRKSNLVLLDKEYQTIWERPLGMHTGDRVVGISIDKEGTGNIIVSDVSAQIVRVFNENGEELYNFPTLFIKEPGDVCVDSSGRVWVSDMGTNTISMLTMQGNFIQEVIKIKDKKVKMEGIAIFNNTYLAVGTEAHGLWLYKLKWSK